MSILFLLGIGVFYGISQAADKYIPSTRYTSSYGSSRQIYENNMKTIEKIMRKYGR